MIFYMKFHLTKFLEWTLVVKEFKMNHSKQLLGLFFFIYNCVSFYKFVKIFCKNNKAVFIIVVIEFLSKKENGIS